MNKPKLGDKFFLVENNYIPLQALSVYVKKVGRKYFWVGRQYNESECFWYRFCVADHSDATQYGNCYLYKSEQDYRNHIEARKLYLDIARKHFTHSLSKSVTLDKLKKINAILEEDNDI